MNIIYVININVFLETQTSYYIRNKNNKLGTEGNRFDNIVFFPKGKNILYFRRGKAVMLHRNHWFN